jgi:hypothetical protein
MFGDGVSLGMSSIWFSAMQGRIGHFLGVGISLLHNLIFDMHGGVGRWKASMHEISFTTFFASTSLSL